jgi:hypothetical protein
MESTWETRDLPVLAHIVEFYDEHGYSPDPSNIAGPCGFEDDEDAQRALRALVTMTRHSSPNSDVRPQARSSASVHRPDTPAGQSALGLRLTRWPTVSLLRSVRPRTTSQMRRRRASSAAGRKQ